MTFSSFLQLGFLSVLAVCVSPLAAASLYVNPLRGSDTNDGSQEHPFKSVARALKEADGVGGEINLSPDGGPYREGISIKKGGKPENPLIINGNGAVVNLGIDVTAGPWIDTGNGFLLNRPVAKNGRLWLATVAFANGVPISCDSPKGSGAFHDFPASWHGGSARYDEQGRLILIFPKGLTPSNAVVVLPSGATGDFACGISVLGASYVQIRNITAAFAANDGFNFHDGGHDVVLENVKGLFNGDQGTSAHETCQVDVKNSEFAFNGSGDGAVEDIQNSVTSYHNIRVHQNRNHAFSFPKPDAQSHHTLDGVVSFGNGQSNLPPSSSFVELNSCEDQGPAGGDRQIPTVADPNAAIDPAKSVEENDRLGRFLQLRP